jgi:glucose-6-phosphate isomerase
LTQSIETARAEMIGPEGITAAAFVDPFDQPAVEAGKVLAKRYLKGE